MHTADFKQCIAETWSGWVSFNCQEHDNWGATEVWAILITYRWTEKHGETIFVAETIKSKMNVTVVSIPLICFVTQIWFLVLEGECRCSWLCYRVKKEGCIKGWFRGSHHISPSGASHVSFPWVTANLSPLSRCFLSTWWQVGKYYLSSNTTAG